MTHTHDVTLINSRTALLVYAAVAFLFGIQIAASGSPIWLKWYVPPDGLRHYVVADWTLARWLGTGLVAASIAALTLAAASDQRGRRLGLLWLAVVHLCGVVAITFLHPLVVGRGYGELLMGLLTNVAVLLFLSWWYADGHKPGTSLSMTRLFGTKEDAAVQPLRSRYEQEIRRAAAQEERNRLARDLHDSVKQQLFVIQTAAATSQERFHNDPAGAQDAIEAVRRAAREALGEMEAMLEDLNANPLENTGLVEALKQQSEALGYRTGAQVSFECGPLPASEALPPGTHQAIFRTAQEALANVARHARAHHVRVILTHDDDSLTLVVQDDGSGFERHGRPGGRGLDNMRERAHEVGGGVTVVSGVGSGTTVTLVVPASSFPRDVWRSHRNQMLGWAASFVGISLLRTWQERSLIESPVTVSAVLLFGTMCVVEAIAWIRTRPGRRSLA